MISIKELKAKFLNFFFKKEHSHSAVIKESNIEGPVNIGNANYYSAEISLSNIEKELAKYLCYEKYQKGLSPKISTADFFKEFEIKEGHPLNPLHDSKILSLKEDTIELTNDGIRYVESNSDVFRNIKTPKERREWNLVMLQQKKMFEEHRKNSWKNEAI